MLWLVKHNIQALVWHVKRYHSIIDHFTTRNFHIHKQSNPFLILIKHLT